MSVFGRLNYNFDSAKFGANNELTDGQKLTLNYPSPLYTWQASDLSGSSVGNYFQNPHSANLTLMTSYTNQLLTYSNTQSVTYNSAPIEANTLNALANNLLIEISSFTDHTNRMSGATESTNKLTIPDYQIAMSIGRQVLQICNQVDGVQNNAPILGNFTSLAVVQDVSNSVIQLASSAATLNASLSIVDGNTYSSISQASMNTIIASAQTAFDLLNSRRVGDTTFYTNSISLIQDYNTILQFSNLGVNSSYLIKDLNIGTTKLQNDLQYSVPSGYPNNIYTGTQVSTTGSSTSSTENLSVTGVVPGNYTTANISVDAYGRVTYANNGTGFSPFTEVANTQITGLITAAQIAPTAMIPSGGIIMWSGSVATIPTGWQLCNGTNGTPDLRDRFVVCAGGATYAVGATGGTADAITVSHSHSLSAVSTGDAGSHNHRGGHPNDGGGSYYGIGDETGKVSDPSNRSGLIGGGSVGGTYLTDTVANHTHTLSGSTDSTGSSGTNANLPPYYALAFIMKV
jgi:hypothetical protein